MSYEVTFNYSKDDEATHQIASSRGWPEFAEWVDGLDEFDYPNLHALTDQGWCNRTDDVADEIEEALDEVPPVRRSVEKTARQILELFDDYSGSSAIIEGWPEDEEDESELESTEGYE